MAPIGMRRASGLYDKDLAGDLLARLDKTKLDDRVHDGGKPDAAEFLITPRDAGDLVGQYAGRASLLKDA